MLVVRLVVIVLVAGFHLAAMVVDKMKKMDWLTLLRQGVKTVDEYYMEMEMLMQRGRVRESLEMTMQRFLNGLKYDVKGIRHYTYTNMNQLLHHAREAESQLAEEAKVKGRATGAGRFTPRAPLYGAFDAPLLTLLRLANRSPMYLMQRSPNRCKYEWFWCVYNGNRDMLCHTCGGKGHFKRDCPNRKVMFINEDNEYETGDDVDPNAPDNDDYDTDGEDAYPSDARTIVVSQRALNVLPSASTQRCNLFQTKALVGPDKACKVIIDGGSCRNLASKELCTKLKLKYLPHPHPYYIRWLSDNGEMKVNHMVRVEFAIGPYQEETGIARGGEEQLDVKMDVKPDMELDMKISHGRAREEREECARGEEEDQPVQDPVDRPHAGRPTHPRSGPRPPTRSLVRLTPPDRRQPDDLLTSVEDRSTGPRPPVRSPALDGSRTRMSESAALEAAVEVVEEDPQLAEYEAWEEAALVATVDAYDAGERQREEAERREREETQRHDEVCEACRLAEMQLRLQRHELDHRRRREELERQLQQEAATADRAAYLTFVADRSAGDQRRRSRVESMGESSGRSSTSTEPSGQ
ncbi:hypothetical protein QYE76_039758 [Lolium multiflorum]|uniref:CCHC-type domain-containing protein n=1 Tax=Lolium multiflorum TaxID=4521 RepID=A0AAD8TAH2_LOLMU|nr:hypothetical protein QYE76_039758 [Lolium multiflorum]